MTEKTYTEKNTTEANLILKELREDIISDLNEYDPSVGLFSVNNLLDWSKDAFNGTSDITIISGDETNLIIKIKGYLFEIFENITQIGEEEYDFYWDIRAYESSEEEVLE